jgi:hypothetical protein
MEDMTDKKDIMDKEKDMRPLSSTIEYTLIDEALMAFESGNYIVLFNSVNTLAFVFAEDRGIKIKRLEGLHYGVEIKDINRRLVKIPCFSLMHVALSAPEYDRYIKTFRDVDRNLVYVYVSDLMEAYYYIGRILHITLFELLKDNFITLPVEMYSNRYCGNG